MIEAEKFFRKTFQSPKTKQTISAIKNQGLRVLGGILSYSGVGAIGELVSQEELFSGKKLDKKSLILISGFLATRGASCGLGSGKIFEVISETEFTCMICAVIEGNLDEFQKGLSTFEYEKLLSLRIGAALSLYIASQKIFFYEQRNRTYVGVDNNKNDTKR